VLSAATGAELASYDTAENAADIADLHVALVHEARTRSRT
jgi:hypothetical protein